MLILPGSPALSAFRKEKLLQSLPGIEALSTRYLHFVEVSEPLDEGEQATLAQLLAYGPSLEDEAVAGTRLLVVPRPGTISPWSSKATDICHNAGLAKVVRVERGIAYQVALADPADEATLAAVRAAIHDRMTEAVLDSDDQAEQLFVHQQPRHGLEGR